MHVSLTALLFVLLLLKIEKVKGEDDPYDQINFDDLEDDDDDALDADEGDNGHRDSMVGDKGEVNLKEKGDDDNEEDEDDSIDGFHMDDFSPSHVLTFPLSHYSSECFYEDIFKERFPILPTQGKSSLPVQLRGAYFVSALANSETGNTGASLDIGVDISRMESTKNRRGSSDSYFTESGKDEGTFSVEADVYGTYTICFTNNGANDKSVTFALHVGNKKKEHAKKEHVTPIEENVRRAHKALTEIVSEQNFLILRTQRHMQTQDSTSWRVVWYTVFESFFMLAVTIAQIMYVRRLVDQRPINNVGMAKINQRAAGWV